MPTNIQRPLDLVLYGASGFVGRQTVAYIAQFVAEHPNCQLKWAIAGRSQAKLEAVLAQVAVQHPAAAQASVVVADAHDPVALADLAAKTRVVLSTAGPYAVFGSALVQACVDARTHYCDITGETPWVRSLIDRHHEQALQDGTRIVPFCGFDSVPSDMGVFLLIEAFKARGDVCASVKSMFTIGGGGFNGGTVASLMNVAATGQSKAVQDLFLLNPQGNRPLLDAGHEDPISPSQDADFGAWIGPFIMGQINSRVVRRSAALLGNTLAYQEHMRFGRGAGAAVAAAAVSFGMLGSQAALSYAPVRGFLNRFVPQAGEGPSVEAMDKGFFKCELIGTSSTGGKLRAVVADRGDAGNRATTKMVCEAALALVMDEKRLPKAAGVITPSVAFGQVLAERMRAAGMRVEVMDLASKAAT